MLNKIWNYIKDMQEARAAYYALSKMTDKELHDIGIGRGDIKRVAYRG